MHYLRVILFVSLSAISATTVAASDDSYKTQEEFAKRYVIAMKEGKAESLTHLFSERIKIMPEYDKTFIGLESARGYFASIFKRYRVTNYFRNTMEVTNFGERRLVIGSFKLTIRNLKNDRGTAVTGTYFDIWDTSTNDHRLLTLAWNFDEKVDGIENAFRANHPAGIHYAFTPTVPTGDKVSAEVMAARTYGAKLMLRRQPSLLVNAYHPDAWYSPHDQPIVKGKSAIKEFNIEYAKNWPSFDYVDTNPHELYENGNFVLEHMSYNLRWRTPEDYSGISIGKGIRLWKRDSTGVLKSFRQIAMHD